MNRKILTFIIFHFYCLIILKAQDSIPIKPEHLFGIYTGSGRDIIRDHSRPHRSENKKAIPQSADGF